MATDTIHASEDIGRMSKARVYKNFIDGEWVEASTGETLRT